jgi:hypothetical protein
MRKASRVWCSCSGACGLRFLRGRVTTTQHLKETLLPWCGPEHAEHYRCDSANCCHADRINRSPHQSTISIADPRCARDALSRAHCVATVIVNETVLVKCPSRCRHPCFKVEPYPSAKHPHARLFCTCNHSQQVERSPVLHVCPPAKDRRCTPPIGLCCVRHNLI